MKLRSKVASLCILLAVAVGFWAFFPSAKPTNQFGTRLAEQNTKPNLLVQQLKPPAHQAVPVARHANRRQASPNAGSMDPKEAIERVEANVSEFVRDLSSAAKKPTITSSRSHLTRSKQEQLSQLELDYGAIETSRLALDHNRNLTGLFPKIPLTGTSMLDADQVSTSTEKMVNEHRRLFGLGESGEIVGTETSCSSSICTSRVSKRFRGLPAWDHTLVISSGKTGVISVLGEFEEPRITNFEPRMMSDGDIREEIAFFFRHNSDAIELSTVPELGIARESGHDFIAYKVTASISPFKKYEVYLNTNTGKVVRALPLFYEVAVPASGTNLEGETVSFEADQSGSVFGMVDSRFPIGFFTIIGTAPGSTPETSLANAVVVSSNDANSGWDPAGVSALNNAKILIDYYKSEHNYNAVNEAGKNLAIIVNGDYGNAYASGDDLFLFGAGDASFSNLAGSLDVMAHEITHGVISTKSNLEYRNQSGALNESFADFFGTALDTEDWTVGEDVYLIAPFFLRSLSNPLLGNQPSHFSDYRYTSIDNGGVHINSGIPNRAQYLIAEGLSAEGLGESIGRHATAQITFETMGALDPNATFTEAAMTMEAIAGNLFGEGSAEQTAVTAAWQAVGIPPEDTQTSTINISPNQAQGENVAVYLNPIFDVSTTLPSNNSYRIYQQIYTNQSPTYSPDANPGPPNTQLSSYKRPSIVTFEDESYLIVFQGIDGKTYLLNGDESPVQMDDGLTLSSLTVTPDGERLILVFEEAPVIFIYEIATENLSSFVVSRPNFTEGAPPIPVESIDSVRVDPTSRKVVFDFLTCGELGGVECGSQVDAAAYWSIGILEIGSGVVSYPFPSQPARFDVGYPSFSNLTDRYLVFDLIDSEATTQSGVASNVVIYDSKLSGFEIVANPDITTAALGAWGLPSFSADDSGITFAAAFDGNQSLLFSAALQNYAISNTEEPYTNINPFLAFLPMSTPAINADPKPSLAITPGSVNLGDLAHNQVASIQLCAANSGYFPIDISDLSTSIAGLSWTGSYAHLESAEEICGTLRLDAAKLDGGRISTTAAIVHTGANSPTPFTISATVELDTDGDDIGNNTDTDDDGDGLSDDEEATVGTNPLVADTDGDGLNDAAELDLNTDPLNKDSDGDSMPDGLEVADGLDPLDNSDCPDYFCGSGMSGPMKVIFRDLIQDRVE